ncbi:unnamed protein product [Diplocarpon coronariae]
MASIINILGYLKI